MELPDYTVIFDNKCLFCSSAVRFLIKHDKKNFLWFADSNAEIVQKNVPDPKQLKHSILFYMNNVFYKESTAVLKIFRILPFPYSLLYTLIIIPSPLRDLVYKIVARIRYKISELFKRPCYISSDLTSRLLS